MACMMTTMISRSRRAILLSLAGLAGFIALVVLDLRPASPSRVMPVFAISEDDADPLVAFRSGLGLDVQSLIHESAVDTITAYPVNCTNAICRKSRSAEI